MANPATLTINSLTLDSSIAKPAGDAIDTTGNVPLALGGVSGRTILVIDNNSSTQALTVAIKAGDYPPAALQGQGDVSVTIAASSGAILGPFNSARFAKQGGGSFTVNFTPASGSPNATVRVYSLPKA